MKEPETIIGYISLLKKIEKMTISDKKGFENLPLKTQEQLYELVGQISNIMNEIDANGHFMR